MDLFTVQETKSNSLGTFVCRVLGLEYGGSVLLIRPCLNPECPDLGFRILPAAALEADCFMDEQTISSHVNVELLKAMFAKLDKGDIPETDQVFTQRWFAEVAELTNLKDFQKKTFSRLL